MPRSLGAISEAFPLIASCCASDCTWTVSLAVGGGAFRYSSLGCAATVGAAAEGAGCGVLGNEDCRDFSVAEVRGTFGEAAFFAAPPSEPTAMASRWSSEELFAFGCTVPPATGAVARGGETKTGARATGGPWAWYSLFKLWAGDCFFVSSFCNSVSEEGGAGRDARFSATCVVPSCWTCRVRISRTPTHTMAVAAIAPIGKSKRRRSCGLALTADADAATCIIGTEEGSSALRLTAESAERSVWRKSILRDCSTSSGCHSSAGKLSVCSTSARLSWQRVHPAMCSFQCAISSMESVRS